MFILLILTHGCTIIARDDEGKLYSWGRNNYGQLGNGTTIKSSIPICISDAEGCALNGKNIVDVYYNDCTVIARDDGGKLYTWGYNNCGQLGNGTTVNSSIPICISEIEGSALSGKNIVDVYYNYGTVIAQDREGKLYSWGENWYGELGNGTTGYISSIPTCISEIEGSALKEKNIVDVYTVDGFVLARDDEGKLYSWGRNNYGQLGNGTTIKSSIPICISDAEGCALNGKNIVDVYYNDCTVIARDDGGKLYTWGCNSSGQLGNGTYDDSYIPKCISEIEESALNEKNIVDFYFDGYSVFAWDNQGQLYAWGYNYHGELGNGTTENSSIPICINDVSGSELNDEKIKSMDYYYYYYYYDSDETEYEYQEYGFVYITEAGKCYINTYGWNEVVGEEEN